VNRAGEGAWYRELDSSHWHVLAAAFLGWVFDGYEAYALFLVMAPALRTLLPPEQMASLSSYAGILVAVTLLGWALGGVSGASPRTISAAENDDGDHAYMRSSPA
jgi:hypothetical protein